MDKKPDSREVSGVLEVHEQVAESLGHPGMSGVRGGAKYSHPPADMVDDGENVLALPRQRDRLDEVHRQDHLSLRTQEVSPGSGRPARSRINAGGLEDPPHRGGGDREPEKREFAMDASISPRGTGSLAVLLASAGHEVQGLDISDEMVKAARTKAAGCQNMAQHA
jgi:hypothetical protein